MNVRNDVDGLEERVQALLQDRVDVAVQLGKADLEVAELKEELAKKVRTRDALYSRAERAGWDRKQLRVLGIRPPDGRSQGRTRGSAAELTNHAEPVADAPATALAPSYRDEPYMSAGGGDTGLMTPTS